LQNLEKHKKTKDLKEFFAILAPVCTAFALVVTIAVQSYQFSRAERDKAIDARQQRDAAEDASWSDALKQVTESEKLPPTVVLLKRFGNSPRYAGEAQAVAYQLLLRKTGSPDEFQGLFETAYLPLDWSRFPQVVEIDRQIYQEWNTLAAKIRDSKTDHFEKERYDKLAVLLDYLSGQIAVLLKGPRTSSQSLDLHSTAIWDTDLQGADLSGADLTAAGLMNLNLKGAKFNDITKFENANFFQSSWWESAEIASPLREYLEKSFPLMAGLTYGGGHSFTKEEYEAAVNRLRASRR